MRTALLALVLLLVPAAVAAAQSIENAAQALRSDEVYVDPAAEAADEVDAGALRQRIADSGAGPVYIAVLPASAAQEAGGDAREAAAELANRGGRPGAYGVIVGRKFYGRPSAAADAALQDSGGNGAQALLDTFVDRVADGGDGSSDGGGGEFALVLLGAGAIGGGALLLSRRRRRQREAAEFAE